MLNLEAQANDVCETASVEDKEAVQDTVAGLTRRWYKLQHMADEKTQHLQV